jgi:hypothetical protein
LYRRGPSGQNTVVLETELAALPAMTAQHSVERDFGALHSTRAWSTACCGSGMSRRCAAEPASDIADASQMVY